MNKNLQIAGLVALVLIVGWLGVSYPVPAVVEKIVERLGASPGPDRFNPIESMNGVCRAFYSGEFTDATTTVLSIKNPFNATSTAVLVNVYGTNGTTSILLSFGTSSTPSAQLTTNLITDGFNKYLNLVRQEISTSTGFVIAGSGGDNTATSTNQTRITLGPSDYFVAVATGTTVGGFNLGAKGLTNTNDTFSGNYSVEIWK